MTLVVIEYADPTAFSGFINATCVRVIDQYVGRFADFVVVDDSSVGQVHRHHRRFGFAADEHHLIGGVQRKTVGWSQPGVEIRSVTVKLSGSMAARSLRPCTATTI